MAETRDGIPARALDLNADLGETDGDIALMSVVTSASVACGGHAGDEASMRSALEAALAHKVVVGAHVSYEDRGGFGRVELGLDSARVASAVYNQLDVLCRLGAGAGTEVRYLKPHGALYHRAAHDRACAEAICDVLEEAGPRAVLAQPGELLEAARRRGFSSAVEGFCDRAYRSDGSLVARGAPGALLDLGAALGQARSIAIERRVIAADGYPLALEVDSLCLHGDTPGALAMAAAVRRELVAAGVEMRPCFGP